MNKVLCSAPFNSLTINPDKSVNPCCAWDYKSSIGNLNKNSIQEIRSSTLMQEVKQHMIEGKWHPNCRFCKQREDETGTSVRTNVYHKVPFDASEKVLYLEYSSTNTCNLACAMCNEDWSSAWVELSTKNGWNKDGKHKIEPINREIATTLLENIDLSNLQTLWLKGGEPFLNKENILVLEKLKKIDQLKHVNVMVTTNCTVINEPILELLEQAKSIIFVCSIDAIGELNTWIRFAPNTQYTSDIDNIQKTLSRWSKLKNIDHFALSCAVSVYNIFNLLELKTWWDSNIIHNHSRSIKFTHFVIRPEVQSARVLLQPTLNSLITYYKSINDTKNSYSPVIDYLSQGSLHDDIHNLWVKRTVELNKLRNKNIEDIVPQLKNDLVLIEPK